MRLGRSRAAGKNPRSSEQDFFPSVPGCRFHVVEDVTHRDFEQRSDLTSTVFLI